MPVSDSQRRGLTSVEAADAFSRFGPNEAFTIKRHSAIVALILLFLNPLALILLFAAGVEGFLGQKIDAGIIVVIVVLGIVINFLQTYRSQAAAEKLKQQVLPTATVMRDSKWEELPRRAVVPGDLIRLSAGDLVPADSILVEAKDLHIQQGALTGESFPAEKQVVEGARPSALPDSPFMVFLGTSVVSGMALATVTATGAGTAFGGIAQRLSTRAEETEFERGLRRFGGLIMQTVLSLLVFLLVVSIALHHDAFQSLLFAVSLAVGLTPEFLPMITSVTLAKGAVQMARRNVIVKHLASIQNLGSIDVLCSDKTGTLTGGVMKVDRAVDPFGQDSESVMTLAWLNSANETGIRSPLDAAILESGRGAVSGYEKLDEIPFDFERRRVSIVVRGEGSIKLISKGSPEGILSICSHVEGRNGMEEFLPQARDAAERLYRGLSGQGFRILAVAYRVVEAKAAWSVGDESALCLAGFLTFSDPPLEDAAQMLASLRRDGVALKIITGDNELVTRHVCESVGMKDPVIVLGDSIDSMTDPTLGHVAENASVFARVSPAQKNRIILALKHRGHVVGYLGDGINDAPSLHAADVGISVASAVDVAREAADIILVRHGLDVLHAGILEGRKAFGNVMKYLLMGTSSNFGNMFSMAGASLVLPFLPMLPTQILLNNFLYDLSQVTIPTDNVDGSWIGAPQKWNIATIRRFMVVAGPISSIYDFLTFYVLLHWFRAPEPLFHTGWFVESLATQTLVLFVIRTAGNPFRSRPSRALAATIVAIVVAGLAIPFTPLAGSLGFVPLPFSFFAFLTVATVTYLALVETAKRRLLRY